MAGTITLANHTNSVYRLVNEAANTTVAELQSGTGSSATLSSAAGVQEFSQRAVSMFCRGCYPVRGRFKTSSSVAANTRHIALDDLIVDTSAVPSASTSAKPWAFIQGSVFWGSTRLDTVGQERLAAYDPAYLDPANTATAPTYCYDIGQVAIGLYKIPTGTGTTLTISCLYVPTISASGAMLPDIPDEWVNRVIEPLSAVQVAIKQLQDPDLANRIAPLLQMANDGIAANWRDMDDYTKGTYYSDIPPALLTFEGMAAMAGVSGGG